MELKKTPFYDKHVQNRAKIVDFSGWALPIEYESILKEAKAARTTCGLFDASHMGEIKIEGQDALAFLQRLTPNDISLTKQGELQYNVFLNENSGIVDDLMIYNFGQSFLCVVNASNIEKVYAWLKKNQNGKIKIINDSNNISLLSLQGPCAHFVMEKIFGKTINNLKYMHFIEDNSLKMKILISRSGYTGEDGFEMYIANADAPFLWDLILEKGKASGLTLCGLGARDVLRIEAGYPLYGHEINDTTNPLEASLGWVVKLNKDFIAKENIVSVKKEGLRRKRVGFVMEERAPARQGYPIYVQNQFIGEVTSGTYSPNLEKFIGMAYVGKEWLRLATPVNIKIRDKFYKAKIVKFPFVQIKTIRSGSGETANVTLKAKE